MRRHRSVEHALPPRLRRYVLAVVAVGLPVVAAAAVPAARSNPSSHVILGVCMFFVFTLLAEWRPVPIDPGGNRLVSLAFVFIIASRLIFGWEWSVLIGAGAIGLAMAGARSEPLKVAFNVATYAIAGALSSLALLAAPPTAYGYGSLALCVVLSGAIFILVNVLMVCVAMGLARETPVLPIFMDHLRQSGPIFGIMVFVSAQAVKSVARLAVELARRLGVEGEELEHIHLAALLHDIGKIAVPEHILNKAGRLTPVEQALVERHSVIGYELVRGLALSPVDEYVLHHQERWDGAGYPHGLAGADIPFGSRLIPVADAFDALTSDRSYRAGVSVEAAMHELQAESGRQFDPLIVSALHDWLICQPSGEVAPTVEGHEWSLLTSPS